MPHTQNDSRGEDPQQADGRRLPADLPRLAGTMLCLLLPYAEREEVVGEVAAEHRARVKSSGNLAASMWLWRQVLASAPALARRGWWRGWSGFEPKTDSLRPGGAMFEGLAIDARYAVRRLRKRPTYTVLTVLTLSLGVAGTAAAYGIAQRLLLEPLPVPAEEEVVTFWMEGAWSDAELLYLRPEMDGFRSVAAFRGTDVTLQQGDEPATLVRGVSASAELLEVLGVSAAIGRGFQPGDDRQGAEPVAVLSHSLWRELGGDPAIVGTRLELAGVLRTVVGVMPSEFWFPDPAVRIWLSLELDPEDDTENYGLIGRLPVGTGIEAMGAELARITTLLGERFTYSEQWDLTENAELTPLREYLIGSVRPALVALLAAMAVLLLIACVNVAALMLGQVDSRGTELTVRTALGAARRRLLGQIVVEALMIGALAGLAGTGLALLGFRFLVGVLPLGALAASAMVDWTVFWAAMGVALVAATAVALVPGAFIVRSDLQRRLTRSGAGGVPGRGSRLEGGLVVAQVALVLMMACSAALLIRSVANLGGIDPGTETAGVGVVDIVMPVTTPMEGRAHVVRELVAAVEAIPGVASAGATQRLPLRGSSDNWGILVESRPELEVTSTAFRVVTPEYFVTMGIQLRVGRGLLETDRLLTEEGVVVINQALAEHYFPDMNPIGQRVAFMDSRWDRIVGVVNDVAESELASAPEPARYVLYDHLLTTDHRLGVPGWAVPRLLHGQTIVFRTSNGRDPTGLLGTARHTIQTAVPGVAVQETTTMTNVFNRAIGPARQVMTLLSLLSGLALVLGVVGVYGVVSHFVARRKRDWGIRIALGMRPSRVVGRIVGASGALVGMGIALGLIAFLALARLLASFLYGVGTADPVALAGATAVLLTAGLLAAYIPARRASRIDPALVLREE